MNYLHISLHIYIYVYYILYGQCSSIIGAYAPTKAQEVDQKLEFYDNLQKNHLGNSSKTGFMLAPILMQELDAPKEAMMN